MVNLMAYVIYFTFFLAVVHFIYEGVFVPSLRLQLKYKLFALRDRLRRLKVEDNKLDSKAYCYLQESLNMSIHYLHIFDLRLVWNSRKATKENENLKKRVDSRYSTVEECTIKEYEDIQKEYGFVMLRALLVNNLLLLLPIIFLLIIALLLKIINDLPSKIFTLLKPSLFISEKESNRYVNVGGVRVA